MTRRASDPVFVEVAWNRLISVVEHEAQALLRAAFTTIVRESGDLSAGVFNRRGEMIAQAVTGTPGHINSMALAVEHMLKICPPETLSPGDVLATNDPWLASGHLNDITVVTPVFRHGRVVALTKDKVVVDIGYKSEGQVPLAEFVGTDGQVTVNELIEMVNIALGNADVPTCLAGDANGDGEITVNEIVAGVNNALNGCPG